MASLRRTVRSITSILLVALVGVLLLGCASQPETEASPESRMRNDAYQRAWELVRSDAEGVALTVQIASRAATAGDGAGAAAVLRSVSLPDVVDDVVIAVAWLDAWQRTAAADPIFAAEAAQAVTSIRSAFGDDPDSDRFIAVTVAALRSLVENENEDAALMQALLDDLYVIPDDARRVRALVETAGILTAAGDAISINPVVQQAIPLLPALEDGLLYAENALAVAAFSDLLGRPGDAETHRARAAESLTGVTAVPVTRIAAVERVVTRLVEAGMHREAESLLARLAPAAVAALARSHYAALIAAADVDRGSPRQFDEALRTAAMIGDPARRVETQAAIIDERTTAQAGWDPRPSLAATLDATSMGDLSPATREQVVTSLALSLVTAGFPGEAERLRGLITGEAELRRATLTIAGALAARRFDLAAYDLLGRVPVAEAPARTARVYLALGDTTGATRSLASAAPGEAAAILVEYPGSWVPTAEERALLAAAGGER